MRVFTFMKYALFLFCVCLCGHTAAQNPFKNSTWSGNHIIGLKDFKFYPMLDSLPLDTLNSQYPYGYITEFKETTFMSYNKGWCGNECRAYVSGTYEVEGNKIRFFVQTIHYQKLCSDEPMQQVQQSLGTFYWKTQGPGFLIWSER